MKLSVISAVALASLPSLTSAHYFFPYLFVNNVRSDSFEYVRRSTQGFQPHFGFDILSSPEMRCNTGAQANAGSTKVAAVKAGDTIGFGTNVAGDIQHPGPVQVYMSRAPGGDVKSYDGSGDWFKVFELGANFPMESSGRNWKVWGKNRIDVQIPAETPAGQYLVRIEHDALHRPSGTEFYFNCAHVEVANSGASSEPSDVVKIPGVYNSSTAGLSPNFSIYSGATSYPMPGPAVFPGASKQASGESKQASGESKQASGASKQASGESKQASGAKTSCKAKFSRRYFRRE